MAFVDAYTDLMDQINRPLTETAVLASAKKRINEAVMIAQQERAMNYTQRLTKVPYPANTLMINLSTVCEGTLRDVMSVQVLGTVSDNGGDILFYKTYNQIQAARRKYQLKRASSVTEYDYLLSQFGHETYTGIVHKYYAFSLANNIGLYPVPTAAVNLLLHSHIWLPQLSADADTNFFLDFAYNVIMDIALQRMCVYMKEDNRYLVTQNQIDKQLSALRAWDSQVAESSLTDPV